MSESLDRATLARRAIAARARGDWQAERDALDATHLVDIVHDAHDTTTLHITQFVGSSAFWALVHANLKDQS